MAGRGTDIVLGGNWQAEVEKIENPTEAQIEKIKAEWKESHDAVLASGGLHIIGTERHESRRIDNQLRGRSDEEGQEGDGDYTIDLKAKQIHLTERGQIHVEEILQQEGMLPEGESLFAAGKLNV